jgi:hypothetical protein
MSDDSYVRQSWTPTSPVSDLYWKLENSRAGRAVNDTWDALRRGAARVEMFLGGTNKREVDFYKAQTRDMNEDKRAWRAEAAATKLPARFRLPVRGDVISRLPPSIRAEPTFRAPPKPDAMTQLNQRFTAEYLSAQMRASPGPEYDQHFKAVSHTLYSFAEQTRRAIERGDRRVDASQIVGADTNLGREWLKEVRGAGFEVVGEKAAPVKAAVSQSPMERLHREVTDTFNAVREKYSSAAPDAASRYAKMETLSTLGNEIERAQSSGDRTVDLANIKGADTRLGREWIERLSDAGIKLTEGAPETKPTQVSVQPRAKAQAAVVERAAAPQAQQSFWKDDRREAARAAATPQGRAPDAGVMVQQQRQMRMG